MLESVQYGAAPGHCEGHCDNIELLTLWKNFNDFYLAKKIAIITI